MTAFKPNTRSSSTRSRPRVRRWQWRLGSHRLVISLRRFRTRRDRRSRRYPQLVIQFNGRYYREATFAWQEIAGRRQQYQARLRPAFMPLSLMIIGISGLLVFGAQALSPNLNLVGARQASAEPITLASPPVLPHSMPKSVPVGLSIPKIQLDAMILPVGLRTDGSIAMPNVFDKVGWYDQGPAPGQVGPAVIVGHVDSIYGIAVFWNLRLLVPGDTIAVARADGSTANFTVTNVQQFPQDQFPTSAVYGNIGYAGLRLITCGGTFSTATHHYSDNAVVYAALSD